MTLRWGFLGASHIGRRSLAPAVAAAGHRLVAVGARDLDRARAFAAEFAAARAFGSYGEVIDDPEVDAIYNGLTNDAHLLWTLRALEAGKHVLCEKPLGLSAAEVLQMQHSRQRSGCLVLEAFAPPFHPQFDRALDVVSCGGIGRLVAMQGWMTSPPQGTADFRWAAALGGGALFDLGGYCVSAMRWLSGTPLLRVTAARHMARGVDASLGALLEFEGDIAGQFICSFRAERSQGLVLLGTDGQIRFDAPFQCRDRVTILEINGRGEPFTPVDPYAAMVKHFGDAIAGAVPLLRTLEDSLVQAQALDALFAAASSGHRISLPQPHVVA